MNKRLSVLRGLLCLLLAGCTLLCGCLTPSDGGSTTTTTTTTTTTSSTTGGGQTPAPTPTVYPNGVKLDGIGDRLAAGAPVLSPVAYDAASATAISENDLRRAFRGDGPDREAVLRVEEGSYTFSGNGKTYDGNGAILILSGGLVIEDCSNVTIQNLTVIGSLQIKSSENLRLENVSIIAPEAVAVTVDAASKGVTLRSARIEGKTAVESGASSLAILRSAILFSESGILDSSESGLFVRDCRMTGTAGSAIKTAGDRVEIRNNTIKTASDATAVEVGEAKHVLVAANLIEDAQRSISVTGADNVSILRNTVISVDAQNGKHIYIVDNAVGGRVSVSDNSYLIVDGSTHPADELNHETVSVGNNETNGDGLMDVDKRLSVGADMNLLPHVDKLQFVFEEPQATVYDPEGAQMEIDDYVLAHAAEEDYVYIAPGAYSTTTCWELRDTHSGTTIYAYGAYVERPMDGGKDGYAINSDYWSLIHISGAKNITVKGGSYGYERPQCGQGYVIKKVPNSSSVVIVTAAGMLGAFGAVGIGSDIAFELSGGMAFREGTLYPYVDLSTRSEVKNADGTITVTLKKNVYDMVEVGDVFGCHNRLGAWAHVSTENSTDILYKDMSMYGNTGAACFGESLSSVTYYRVADIPDAGRPITKEVYDEYKAIEKQYGITTDVWTDGENYFGAPSRFSSKDATHVASSLRGSHIISCRFENMIDDATNQRSAHARLSTIYDNGDGTMTVVYKPNVSKVSYDRGTRTPSGLCQHFKDGDRVYIYASNGKLVVDGPAIGDYTLGKKISTEFKNEGGGDIQTYKVIVSKDDVDTTALEGYTLDAKNATSSTNNTPGINQVVVDNRSRSSDNFFIDNLYTCNIRSRGLLIKSSGGTIKNCTFENISAAAVAIYYELEWGESGVSENITIKNNLMLHTGYRETSNKKVAPISVQSLGYHDFTRPALYNNITIVDNVMRNRACDWAVYIYGASDVTITGNDFGRTVDMQGLSKKKQTVCLDTVNRVTISDNTYPDPTLSVKASFNFTGVKGLTGTDVNGGDMFPDFK